MPAHPLNTERSAPANRPHGQGRKRIRSARREGRLPKSGHSHLALNLKLEGKQILVGKGRSSATPSSERTRKSDGRIRIHCAPYSVALPRRPRT